MICNKATIFFACLGGIFVIYIFYKILDTIDVSIGGKIRKMCCNKCYKTKRTKKEIIEMQIDRLKTIRNHNLLLCFVLLICTAIFSIQKISLKLDLSVLLNLITGTLFAYTLKRNDELEKEIRKLEIEWIEEPK